MTFFPNKMHFKAPYGLVTLDDDDDKRGGQGQL